MNTPLDPETSMRRIDTLLSHVWMVRTFLKHSEEAEEDDELSEVHRELYDFMLALGPSFNAGDTAGYFKQARKKWSRFEKATRQFLEIQPQISSHTNFQMAARSLAAAVAEIRSVLDATP
jgi:hypothetical protein